MTQEEIAEIVALVKAALIKQGTDISTIPTATSVDEDATTIPARTGTTLMNIPLSLIGGNKVQVMTFVEYRNLSSKENVIYMLTDGDGLKSIYFGSTKIANRSGEETTIGFPYTFPFTF